MRFFDSLKIALHSIVHNKIRTLITVLIVLVVSFLIMVISIMTMSFYKSVDNSFVALFDQTGAIFSLQNSYTSLDGTRGNYHGITYDEYTFLMEQFEDMPELRDNIVISGRTDVFYLYDLDAKLSDATLSDMMDNGQFYNNYNSNRSNSQFFSSMGDLDYLSKNISYLKSGRLWNEDDEGSLNVWLSEAFIANASQYGISLKVGDNIVLASVAYVTEDNINYQAVTRSELFKIRGIFLNDALEELNCSSDVFLDIVTMYDVMGDNLDINSVRIISEPKYGYIFNEEYKKMSSIVKAVNNEIEPNVYNNRESDRFRCDIVDNIQSVRMVGGVMIGAGAFIGFMILLISIGSVANSVMISVDKNKKFFGVMMAVGLARGGIRRIVQLEILCVIILATGVAYGILYLLRAYFTPLVDALMTMVGMTGGSVILMPFYLPIIVVGAFIMMSILFARRSLARIINMDVISVISEVA